MSPFQMHPERNAGDLQVVDEDLEAALNTKRKGAIRTERTFKVSVSCTVVTRHFAWRI